MSRVLAFPSTEMRAALVNARLAATRCAKAAAEAIDPDTAMSLCRASGKYAGRVWELERMGIRA
jgi:hypothetical protein